MPSISLIPFFLDHYAAGPQTLPVEEVLWRTRAAFDRAIPGYLEGVCLVPIDISGLVAEVVEIAPWEPLRAEFRSRQSREAPRKFTYVVLESLPRPARTILS